MLVTFNKTPQNVGLICLEIETVEDITDNNSHASIHQTKKMNQKYSYTTNYNVLLNKTLHGFQEGHFPSYHCFICTFSCLDPRKVHCLASTFNHIRCWVPFVAFAYNYVSSIISIFSTPWPVNVFTELWPFKLENIIHHGMYIMCYPCLFKIIYFSLYLNKKVNPIFCRFNKLIDFFVWLFPVPINEHRSLNYSHIAVTVSEVVWCKAFESWLESFLRNFFCHFPIN